MRYRFRVVRRPSRYWLPGTDVARAIARLYRGSVRRGDYVVVSDKALSVARGLIFDEARVGAGPCYAIPAYLVSRVLWGRLLSRPFSPRALAILRGTPIRLIAAHKRLALRVGGFKHFIKPVSEAGIDASNLPYSYVSIPARDAGRYAEELRSELCRAIGEDVNLLVVDTDKTYKPRWLCNIAFSTRPSSVRGVIDLGGFSYFLGKFMPDLFGEYPTPVAYSGRWPGLAELLRVSRVGERAMGHGAGRNVLEMAAAVGAGICSVRWGDLASLKHYPAVVVRPCGKT